MRNELLMVAVVMATALANASGQEKPPVASKQAHVTRIHGESLTDNYRWLQDKKNQEVLSYLEAENAYTKSKTKHLETLTETLYKEALGRIQETDASVPVPDRGYLYSQRTIKGQQYPLYCRSKGEKGAEEIILNVNEMAKPHKFFSLTGTTVSEDNRLLAFLSDTTGFREYHLSVKDLETGKLLEDRILKVTNYVWAADNKTIFYVAEDHAKRPFRLYRHTVGSAKDELVYEEKDELYRLMVSRSRDRKYVIVTSRSSTTTEVRFIAADKPESETKVVRLREDGHEYSVDHRDGLFYIRTNKDAKTFKVVTTEVNKLAEWKELIESRPKVTIQDIVLFRNWLVLVEREAGLPKLAVRELKTGMTYQIDQDELVYSLMATPTPEFESNQLRFAYSSFVTPNTVYELDMRTKKRMVLKQDRVLGGYDKTKYTTERIWATAKDGTKIPISLVYRKDTPMNGSAALWLSGYGSYGAAVPAGFSSRNLPLLDRGVVIAYAHIRGGGDMGKEWHDEGKMLKKKNTFTDFIACADYLMEKKYTSANRLAISGGSAGGLLMGAVLNMRPDLCKVAILDVPFVDVINTMLDPNLPLTVQEYLEWGNPNKKDEYEYMKSYCPYTNIQSTKYPAMLVTTSLNDSQVMYWEPAKYVAKLRTLKTNETPLLFKCNMDGGHGGSSGRYNVIKEQMFKAAFVLDQLGISK